MTYYLRRTVLTIQIWVVFRLPKWAIYWATIRLAAKATTGPYSNQIVPELTVMDALDRWVK